LKFNKPAKVIFFQTRIGAKFFNRSTFFTTEDTEVFTEGVEGVEELNG
jgi:hypothetical protein